MEKMNWKMPRDGDGKAQNMKKGWIILLSVLLTLLLSGRCPEPPRGVTTETLRRWLCGVLAPLLPMHAVPASLSARTVNECVTLIRQNL